MLAGEYAVLQPHGLALAVAVGEVVRATLTDGAPFVTLHAFNQTFSLPPDERVATGLLGFAARALAFLETQHGVWLRSALTLDVAGALGDVKVGLGTSAAVTVATLRAVLADADVQWAPGKLADAARQIHGAGQGAGSGYDVTAIAFGGCIAYHRTPDRATSLAWPAGLYGVALFSGQPAPTQAALDKMPLLPEHLAGIQGAAEDLLAAWSGDAPAILRAMTACDAAFLRAADRDASLVPPHVAELRSVIAAHGCVARASGAGGGDCVLAFADNANAISNLVAIWQFQGGHVVALLPAEIAPIAATHNEAA
jgi:mevalonate kinase